jgi:hypothetical protein
MKVAGMMRLSEIDESKVGKDLMKYSIKWLSDKVDALYFLQIGNISKDVLEFIYNLDNQIVISETQTDYQTGWGFKNNESLDELYKLVKGDWDWVLYPDADDLLPENILDLLQQADEMGAETLRFNFIECFGSIDKIIEVKDGFPIGPHFKAVKVKSYITFIGSDGFNEATKVGGLKRFETNYCMRHLRYANPNGIEERKKMNYFQEYFLQNHNLIDYKPQQHFNYYKK